MIAHSRNLHGRTRAACWLLAALVAALLASCGQGTTEPEAAADSVAALRATLRADPSNHDVRLQLARAQLREGDAAAAESNFRRVIDAGAGNDEVLADLAESMLLQQKFFEARRALEGIMGENGSTDARLLTLYGEARLNQVSPNPAEVRDIFMRAFRALDETTDADITARLDTLTASRPLVALARAHVDCHRHETVAVEMPAPAEPAAGARVLQVGPGRELARPSAAARAARDGDIVEIDAGTYRGDVAVWRQNDLILRGVGGQVELIAAGRHAEGKGIWVFAGDNITAENISFSGARVPNGNGAGIRLQGSGATVRNCEFRNNQNGILGGSDAGPVLGNDILIEFSQFENNGTGTGLTHNIYVGKAHNFTLRYSYSRASNKGHLVKSRALKTAIVYNRLVDGADDASSYLVDIPEGGQAYIVGNDMHQGPNADNRIAISYAEENAERDNNALFVIHNTVLNSMLEGTLVRNAADVQATVASNLLLGVPMFLLDGAGAESGNVITPGNWVTDQKAYDFSLTAEAPAIDQARPPREFSGLQFLPEYEYRHPARGIVRRQVGPYDIGAHEFCGF